MTILHSVEALTVGSREDSCRVGARGFRYCCSVEIVGRTGDGVSRSVHGLSVGSAYLRNGRACECVAGYSGSRESVGRCCHGLSLSGSCHRDGRSCLRESLGRGSLGYGSGNRRYDAFVRQFSFTFRSCVGCRTCSRR